MHVVTIFLGQSITNKLIIGGALGIGHSLHQFHAQTPLEALYLLLFGFNKTWAYLDRLLKACIYSVRVFVPCASLINSAAFIRISPGGM